MNNKKDHVPVLCRQCGSHHLAPRGRAVDATTFGGTQLQDTWIGETIFQCLDCHLQFKHPLHQPEDYANLYKLAPPGVYTHSDLRTDQKLVLETLKQYKKSGLLLDIGCYDGSLLLASGGAYKKHGIEPSEWAAEHCRRNNIQIISNELIKNAIPENTYDAIVAVDVIEHLPQPRVLLEIASASLKPGGVLIISSGNSDTPLWKTFGAKYWYCAFPEHISFINPPWLNAAAKPVSLHVHEVRQFKHSNPKISTYETAKGFIGRFGKYALENATRRYSKGSGTQHLQTAKIGYPGVLDDHLLAVLKK